MRSDFAAACKITKSKIAVPPVPIEMIRSAAAHPQPAWSHRPFVAACAAIAATVTLGAGVAFGGKILSGIRIWLPPTGNAAIVADRLSLSMRPTAESVRAFVAHAPFRLILPTGLPRGARLRSIGTLSGDGRRVLMLMYAFPAPKRTTPAFATFMLSDGPLPFTRGAPPFRVIGVRPVVVTQNSHSPVRAAASWFVGHEDVLITSSLTARQVAHIKASMAVTTSQDALNETIAMTGEIISIGAPTTTAIAERYRLPGMNGDLVDGNLVPALVRALRKAPVTATKDSFIDVSHSPRRAYTLTYRARGASGKSVRIPVPPGTVYESIAAGRVRSIGSVLQSLTSGSSLSGAASRVAAEYDFLVYGGNGRCDLVWTLPRVPRALPIKHYKVNCL